MQFYVNDEEVDFLEEFTDKELISIRNILDSLSDFLFRGVVTAIEIDGVEYLPVEVIDEDINTDEVDSVNFITDNKVQPEESLREEVKKRVPELKKELKNAASEFMLGDEDKAWDIFMDSAEELNWCIEKISEEIMDEAELGSSSEFERIKDEHENTNVHTMTANNLFQLKDKEAAESAEEMAEIAEMLKEFIIRHSL